MLLKKNTDCMIVGWYVIKRASHCEIHSCQLKWKKWLSNVFIQAKIVKCSQISIKACLNFSTARILIIKTLPVTASFVRCVLKISFDCVIEIVSQSLSFNLIIYVSLRLGCKCACLFILSYARINRSIVNIAISDIVWVVAVLAVIL